MRKYTFEIELIENICRGQSLVDFDRVIRSSGSEKAATKKRERKKRRKKKHPEYNSREKLEKKSEREPVNSGCGIEDQRKPYNHRRISVDARKDEGERHAAAVVGGVRTSNVGRLSGDASQQRSM